MKRKWLSININWPAIILGIVFILAWEWGVYAQWLPPFIIPAPSQVVQALLADWPNLMHHTQVTLIQALLGLAIGITLAFFFAIVMDLWPWFNRAFYPFLVVSQTIPTVAIAPILVLWLGYDMTPKIVLVVLTTLFPMVISLLNGFNQVDRDSIQLLSLMGANRWQILRHVKLPASMTYFISGLRVAVSYAFVGSVVAEWLGGFEGLGVYMIQTKRAFAYDKMFAVILLISTISLLFMSLLSLVERGLIPWRYRNQAR